MSTEIMDRVAAFAVAGSPVANAVMPSVSRPTVRPSQLAETATWATRIPRRTGA
ncbi:hypothetical protein [Streptomyces sp. D54]|uniref:hypothetical protein n=1 Tax=Streptomyces sp. D54 TaxID=1290289 RepID=UPI003CE6D9D0